VNANTAVDYRNPIEVRRIGIDALINALGPVGMVYFLQQYDRGQGDYTEERKVLLANENMKDLLHELDALRREKAQTN